MLTRSAGLTVMCFSMSVVGAGFSQDAPLKPEAAMYASLRDVINTGADIFNLQGDYAGCYRLYQGSLLSIKPLLKGETQKEIDLALAEAEKKTNAADKAHRLRVAIDLVREHVKAAPASDVKTPAKLEGELIRVAPKKVP